MKRIVIDFEGDGNVRDVTFSVNGAVPITAGRARFERSGHSWRLVVDGFCVLAMEEAADALGMRPLEAAPADVAALREEMAAMESRILAALEKGP